MCQLHWSESAGHSQWTRLSSLCFTFLALAALIHMNVQWVSRLEFVDDLGGEIISWWDWTCQLWLLHFSGLVFTPFSVFFWLLQRFISAVLHYQHNQLSSYLASFLRPVFFILLFNFMFSHSVFSFSFLSTSPIVILLLYTFISPLFNPIISSWAPVFGFNFSPPHYILLSPLPTALADRLCTSSHPPFPLLFIPVHTLLIFLFRNSVRSVRPLSVFPTHMQADAHERAMDMEYQRYDKPPNIQHNRHTDTNPLRQALRTWLKRQVECTLHGCLLPFTLTHTLTHAHSPM